MALPTIMDQNGLEPQPISTLRAELFAIAESLAPGLTIDLPGALIEDISSTELGGLSLIDQARVDLVNSLTPYGANEFLLTQLGNQAGITINQPTNTSVYVQFTGVPGFIVSPGFLVGDGTYQYSVVTGGAIETLGTVTLHCLATRPGTWAVPASSVTQLLTSVPPQFGLSCTNPEAGTPGAEGETFESYRARVLQASIAQAKGMPSFLRTLLGAVPGVQPRLINILQRDGNWEIIVGGGDPYAVAYAIFQALFDFNNIVGSLTTSRNITVAINDYPDVYDITFVVPPPQLVQLVVTWDTSSTSFTSSASVAQKTAQALSNYINNLQTGFSMNLIAMRETFATAINTIIPTQFLTVLNFDVYIDSILTPPTSGTQVIEGDAEGYFYTSVNNITVNQS